MPPTTIPLSAVKKLYTETAKLTNNFTNLIPEILIENPRRVLILRLACKMSQNEFEDFLGTRNKNITKYETGKISKMQKASAMRIVDRVSEKIKKKVELKEIIAYFKKSTSESSGWFRANADTPLALKARRKGAIESLKKRATPQEKTLNTELYKRGIDHYLNYAISHTLIVDFFIPEKNLVIECKEISSGSKRETKEQIQKLAYQGYKIKFKYPDKEIWALVKSRVKLTKVEMEELQGPYAQVFTDVDELLERFSCRPLSACPESPGLHAGHNAQDNGMQLRKEKPSP